jgi:ribosomal protein S15P/S13E
MPFLTDHDFCHSLQNTVPAPLARTISYNAAGPISALGFNSTTLAQLMSRYGTSDPNLISSTSDNRKAPSKENQAKLRKNFSLLQRDIQDQVRDIDVLEEILKSITQELTNDIKTFLEPISQLDNHFAAVRRALKNQSSRPIMEQKRAKAKQFVKESQAQI